jgi:hypothetical protein
MMVSFFLFSVGMVVRKTGQLFVVLDVGLWEVITLAQKRMTVFARRLQDLS